MGTKRFNHQSPLDSTDPLGLMRVMHSPIVQAHIVRGALCDAFERKCAACDLSDFPVTQRRLCSYVDCIAAASKISSSPFHTIVGNGKRQRSHLDGEKIWKVLLCMGQGISRRVSFGRQQPLFHHKSTRVTPAILCSWEIDSSMAAH